MEDQAKAHVHYKNPGK